MGVATRPTRSTSSPQARRPATSCGSMSGEDRRPSYPTATLAPPFRTMTEPKQRPMAKASSGFKVSPTMPRMSYSRSTVGLKRWLKTVIAWSSKTFAAGVSGPAYGVVAKSRGAHRLRVVYVPEIQQHVPAHRLAKPRRGEGAELVPFGEQHQRVGA